jgi:hypothetical protein
MKRDLGLTFTIIVSMATFAIAFVAGIFLIWETGGATAQESLSIPSIQVAASGAAAGQSAPAGLSFRRM